MKIIIFIITSVLLSFKCFSSTQEIVVLTSIQNPSHRPFWRSKSYEISKDIESQYKEAFKNSGYNLVFKHNANSEILEHFLLSPNTLALFWVSHAAEDSIVNGINFSSIIQDINGNNIKNLFQKVNPNLKFLSVVGCSAKSILNDFKTRGYYHSDLVIHSFDKKIRLNRGIDQSLRAASKVIDADPDSFRSYSSNIECDGNNCNRRNINARENLTDNEIKPYDIEGMRINIINTNPKHSAIICVNDQLVGLLRKGNEVQSFKIPTFQISKKIKIVIEFEKLVFNTEHFQALEIETNDRNVQVDFMKNKDGSPYGVRTNFYYLVINI